MKRLAIYFLLLLVLPSGLFAQTYQVGTSSPDFLTLKEAFDYINSGATSGDIILEIIDNTSETGGTAVLNASGGVNYTSVLIYPTASGLSISGDIAGPLIDLSGADNVTIDGRVSESGPADLVITNTNTGTSASTIRFIESANTIAIHHCYIKGSETSSTSGIIFFSTASTGSGNDGITIDNNYITSDAAGRPLNAIYSSGTSGRENSGCTISNNNIYDFLNNGTASNGILLSSNTTTWTISGNSFYESAQFIPTASVAYNVIQINNASGTGFTVSGNYIGGQAASCGGSPWDKTSAFDNTFDAIKMTVGTGTASIINNNTIKNISWSNSGAAAWYGVDIGGGDVNIGTSGANTIGAATGTGSITVTGGATGTNVYGIYISGTGTVDCQNNTIASITAANSTSTYATNFYGINKTAVSGTTTISSNTIGSTSTASSINASSLSGPSSSNSQVVYGIYSAGTGTITISSNTVANMVNGTTNTSSVRTGLIDGIASTAGTITVSNNTVRDLAIANANTSATHLASVCGIALTGTTNLKTVTGNIIYNLSNSFVTFSGHVNGLYFSGNTGGTNIVSGNFIHSLSVSSSSATINGIKILTGVTKYYNNIIYLSGNTATTINGIYETGTSGNNNNIYFNTVYISGAPTTGSKSSFCLYSAVTTNSRDFRNNVFHNARSNSGATGSHYAMYIVTTGGTITGDYNDYYVSGTGGILGYYGSDKAALPIVTAQDVNSLNIDPVLASPGSTAATGYKIGVDVLAASGTGITTDYSLASRVNPTMGAWENAVNKWKGTTSTDWGTDSNWTVSRPYGTDRSIIFDAAPSRHCYLDIDRSVTNITNGQSTYRLVTNGHKLTIKGNLIFTGGAQIDASSASSTVEYAGSAAQSIVSGDYLNNKAYNLTVNNTSGVSLTTDFTIDNNLTINSGKTLDVTAGKFVTVTGSTSNSGTLYLRSTAGGTASLIAGSSSGTGYKVERYMTGAEWHIISPTVSGQTIYPDFTGTGAGGPNDISYNSGTSKFAIALYSESPDGWDQFFSSSYPGGTFQQGTGYLARRESSGAVTFSGSIRTTTLSVPISHAAYGWNCIGNPFPSALKVRGLAAGSFIYDNSAQFEPGYAALYIYDPANPIPYRIINNTDVGGRYLNQDYIQSGQAFLVKAKTGGGTVDFTTAMRNHNSGTFYKKSEQIIEPWSKIILNAKTSGQDAITYILFREDMTRGLDLTYDAGLPEIPQQINSSGFGKDVGLPFQKTQLTLYSRLVADIGVNFAIQCLPDAETEDMSVPIGLDLPKGGLVTFSADIIELPVGYNAVLEDRLLGIFTDLKTQDAKYHVILPAGTNGTGRFFLHTLSSGKTKISDELKTINTYAAGKEIFIKGMVSKNTNAILYDLYGRKLKTVILEPSDMNSFRVDDFIQGIYILKVIGKDVRISNRVFIE